MTPALDPKQVFKAMQTPTLCPVVCPTIPDCMFPNKVCVTTYGRHTLPSHPATTVRETVELVTAKNTNAANAANANAANAANVPTLPNANTASAANANAATGGWIREDPYRPSLYGGKNRNTSKNIQGATPPCRRPPKGTQACGLVSCRLVGQSAGGTHFKVYRGLVGLEVKKSCGQVSRRLEYKKTSQITWFGVTGTRKTT